MVETKGHALMLLVLQEVLTHTCEEMHNGGFGKRDRLHHTVSAARPGFTGCDCGTRHSELFCLTLTKLLCDRTCTDALDFAEKLRTQT